MLHLFCRRKTCKKALKGFVHFAAHIGCLIGIFYAGRYAVDDNIEDYRAAQVTRGFIHLFGGYIFGSFIMGLYLMISAMLGFHWNEAFSSIKCEKYKSFLRLHICEDGALEVFAIGMDNPNKNWQIAPFKQGDYRSSLIVPTDDYRPKIVDYIKLDHSPESKLSVHVSSSSD